MAARSSGPRSRVDEVARFVAGQFHQRAGAVHVEGFDDRAITFGNLLDAGTRFWCHYD